MFKSSAVFAMRGVLKIREPVREPFGGGSVPRLVLEEGKSALLAQGGDQGTMSDSCPSWLRTGQARCQIRAIRHLGPTGHDVRFVSFVAAVPKQIR